MRLWRSNWPNDLAPAVARFAHAYALTLKQSGQVAAAVRILASALTRHPDDWDMLLRSVRSNRRHDANALLESQEGPTDVADGTNPANHA